MSLKYTTTTADHLEWNEATNLIHKLYKDKKYKMSLLISVGCFWGLRISDILTLRWETILYQTEFTLIEKKTSKNRTIRINPQLQEHIQECYKQIAPEDITKHCFISNKGGVFTVQRINRIFKEIKGKYKLKVGNFSTHTLRKTFGRAIYNKNGDNAEMALVKLSEIFNHGSVATTKAYLGLRREEILGSYDVLEF